MCVCARSGPTLVGPHGLCSPPGSSVHGISGQEYWSGLPFPCLGDFPHPGMEPASPALVGEFLTAEPAGRPHRRLALDIPDEHNQTFHSKH